MFPAGSISGAASLTCPHCSTVFQFRPAQAMGGKKSPPPSPQLGPPLPATESLADLETIPRLNFRKPRRARWVRVSIWLGVFLAF
ncbi:MAG TPA: hypothetical protein VGY77_11065, partial [Gemmataceae bacterium]|nr:hypothetical protein [Gemmataceae bacterium]